MLLRSAVALLLSVILIITLHDNFTGADKLVRHFCQCQGRDIFGRIDTFNYTSDTLNRTFSLKKICRAAPEFNTRRQYCNGWVIKYREVCSQFLGGHYLCYDPKFFGYDTVTLDDHLTKLKYRHNPNYKRKDLMDCTEECRAMWPGSVHLTARCNFSLPGGGPPVPLETEPCRTETFYKLPKLPPPKPTYGP